MNKQTSLETNPIAAARIEQVERELRAFAEKPISFTFNPSGTTLFSIMELRQSYAKRCVDLADTIRSLVSQSRIVPATVIGRALIETVAMGCLYLHEMRRLIDAGDLERLEARHTRFYAGIRGKSVEPVHVMDAMRHLEKIDGNYVAYLDQKFGVFTLAIEKLKATGQDLDVNDVRELLSTMKNYNDLSEISHPNGLGTQFLYPDSSNENDAVAMVRVRYRVTSLSSIWQCHHLVRALGESEDLPERYKATFMASD